MSEPTLGLAGHEPGLHTIEMVCERLGELGLPVGPDTARELILAILASEAPRVDARFREALQTALETIRVAAQSGLGVLGRMLPAEQSPAPPAGPPKPVLEAPRRQPPSVTPRPTPRPRPARRPPETDSGDEFGGERRPVFRRPRGR